MPLICCAEAVMVVVFGALQQPSYYAARQMHLGLPFVASAQTLNRGDPLHSEDMSAANAARTHEYREHLRHDADEGIERKVYRGVRQRGL